MLIRPKKELVLSLVKQMAPEYLELFRDMQKPGGWRTLAQRYGEIRKRLKLDSYATLYGNEIWVAKGGIEPPTHGFSVVIYGVNRFTNGPPSLVEARQDSPSVLRFSQVLGSEPRLSVFIALKPSMNYLPRFIVTSERKQMRLLILHPTKKHLHVGTAVGIALR